MKELNELQDFAALIPQQIFTCSSSLTKINTLKQVLIDLLVTNKDIRTKSLTSFWRYGRRYS